MRKIVILTALLIACGDSRLSPQGGTITSVQPTAGGGLAGGGTSGTVSLGLVTTCADGEVLAWDDGGNTWGCTTAASSEMLVVTQLGAACDGTTDDTVAIQAAFATAASTGKALFFPPGPACRVSRSGGSFFALTAPSGLTLVGVKGESWIKAQDSLPGVSVPILMVDGVEGLSIDGLGFDGNWQNGVTEIAASSDGAALPQGTIYVNDTSNFWTSSGNVLIYLPDVGLQTVACTGKTSTTFTGCTGGTGTMRRHYAVGRQNSQLGLNHTTVADPQSHLVMLRGAGNVSIRNSEFRRAYGDGVYLGCPTTPDLKACARDVQIRDSSFDTMARNSISFGATVDRVLIDNNKFTNTYTTVIDGEPQGGIELWNRDVTITRNYVGGWFAPPGGSYGLLISCVAGVPIGQNHSSAARGWRISDNQIMGTLQISSAIDVVVSRNKFIYDNSIAASLTLAPIFLDHTNDDITIEDNWIFDNVTKSTGFGDGHNGAIHVASYGSGTTDLTPSGVRIRNNRIHARKGVHGIWINSAGGGFTKGDSVATVAALSGTATSVTDVKLVDSGKSWVSNEWVGWTVIRGGVSSVIESNTATELFLAHNVLSTGSYWRTPLGEEASTPGTGTYIITSYSGVLDIDGNDIDLGGDGYTAGGYGIYLGNDRAGARQRVRNNNIKNANGYGVFVAGGSADPILYLEIADNKVWDDQPSATTSAAIRFNDAASLTAVTKVVMGGNSLLGGVSTLLSNVSAGAWLMNDGAVQEWAGYATPEAVVTAPIGSTYQRLDGSTGTSLYVKESGTGNTGWVAVASGSAYTAGDGLTLTVNDFDLTYTSDFTITTDQLDLSTAVTAPGTLSVAGDTVLGDASADTLRISGASGPMWKSGTGSPEGVVTAPIGSIYSRTDGTTNTATYRKETGAGNTGWVADTAGGGAGDIEGVTANAPISGGGTSGTVSVGLTTCSDTQIYKMSGGAWTCSADAGGTSYTAGDNLTLTGSDFDVDPYITLAGSANVATITAGNTNTGQTTAINVIQATNTGSFNTTAGNLSVAGFSASSSASESAGGNTLTNIGIYATASGGDASYSGYFDGGSFQVNGWVTIDDNLTTTGNTVLGNADTDTLTATGSIANFIGTGTSTYLKQQSLNFNFADNATSTGYINLYGYNGGTTQYRNLTISNGNGTTIATFTGSSLLFTTYGSSVLGDTTADTHTITGNTTIAGAASSKSLAVQNNQTAQTGTVQAVWGRSNGTFNTTSSDILNVGVFGQADATRSSGANTVYDYGVLGVGGSVGDGSVEEWALGADGAFIVADSISGAPTAPAFVVSPHASNGGFIKSYGQVLDASAAPTLSSCGGGTPSVTGGMYAFTITVGTSSPGSCTFTFATAFGSTPTCVASTINRAFTTYFTSLSNSAGTVDIATTSFTDGDKVHIICVGDA